MTKIIVKQLSVRDQEDKRYIICKKVFPTSLRLSVPRKIFGIKPSKRHIIFRLAYGAVYTQNKLNHEVQKKETRIRLVKWKIYLKSHMGKANGSLWT